MNDFFHFRETPLHYRRTGTGPWLILLHGFMESLEIWNDLTFEVEKEFSILSIDLPGHGRSGMMGEVHSMSDMADAVIAIAEDIGIEHFVVCGHSMGGYVALDLASRYISRVKGLVLFHSHAAPDDETAKENRRRMINVVMQDHTSFIHQFIPDLFAEENRERLADKIQIMRNRAASTSAKSIVASLEGMRLRSGSLDFLIETEMPLYFVIGRSDSRMPYSKVMAQAMMARNVQVMLLDKVGHMGFLEAPEMIFPALRDFFRRIYHL